MTGEVPGAGAGAVAGAGSGWATATVAATVAATVRQQAVNARVGDSEARRGDTAMATVQQATCRAAGAQVRGPSPWVVAVAPHSRPSVNGW
jgi:hypothetical protein